MNDNYTININAMWKLNNTIGKRLECVDAERAKKLRQKKQRRDKRKNSFRAAKHRYELCKATGTCDKKNAPSRLRKGFSGGSYHYDALSHYSNCKNKAPAKMFSISTYRRECEVKDKMAEYAYYPIQDECFYGYEYPDEGMMFYEDLKEFLRVHCLASEEELSDCGIVEMMTIAYALGGEKQLGINAYDVTRTVYHYDDWGDPHAVRECLPLCHTAHTLLGRGNSLIPDWNDCWDDIGCYY